jgi:hypothetical protein
VAGKFCSAAQEAVVPGVAVGAMEVVGPFKHGEVFKKLNLYLQLSDMEVLRRGYQCGG